MTIKALRERIWISIELADGCDEFLSNSVPIVGSNDTRKSPD